LRFLLSALIGSALFCCKSLLARHKLKPMCFLPLLSKLFGFGRKSKLLPMKRLALRFLLLAQFGSTLFSR
jgi:hypothetical protein